MSDLETYAEAAQRLGCTRNALQVALRKYRLATGRSQPYTGFPTKLERAYVDAAYTMYRTQETCAEAARRLGISISRVVRRMIKAGLYRTKEVGAHTYHPWYVYDDVCRDLLPPLLLPLLPTPPAQEAPHDTEAEQV